MSSIEDMAKQYIDTYISILKDGIRVPVYVNEIRKDGIIIGSLCIGNVWTPTKLDIYKDQLLLEFPELGYFNTEKGLIYVYRTPERQWRRGLNDKVVTICGNMDKLSSTAIISAIFNPRYYTLDALAENTELDAGIAISRKLAVKRENSALIVYHNDITIGYIENNVCVLPKWSECMFHYVNKFMPCESEV